MNFGELCSDVITLTNRPELTAETQLAVRTATLKFHMIDFFLRDKNEKQISFSSSGNNFQLDIPSSFERWRKFAYIRPIDSNGIPVDVSLKPIDPSNFLDEFKRNKADVFYVAGTRLNMKTQNGQNGFLVGWYKYPLVTAANFSSWIAEMYPSIIVEEAAGRIMYALGQVDEGNKFIDPVRGSVYVPGTGHLAVLRMNELEEVAR